MAKAKENENDKPELDEQAKADIAAQAPRPRPEIVKTNKKKFGPGWVNVTGFDGQTHEKREAKIELPIESGEDFVRKAFGQHHPNASPDGIEIEPVEG